MNEYDDPEFKRIVGMIGENYNKTVSPEKLKLWFNLLREFEIKAIANAAFNHMKENAFMPTPADLIKRMEPDFDEIFDRCIKGGSKTSLERVTWSKISWLCKTQLSEKEARAKFKAEYKRQLEISKKPITPMSHQIGAEKEVRPTDKMIDEGAEKYKGKTPAEIKEMLANFKLNKVKK